MSFLENLNYTPLSDFELLSCKGGAIGNSCTPGTCNIPDAPAATKCYKAAGPWCNCQWTPHGEETRNGSCDMEDER